jgi:muramoyltetrapeptide carboxypeptidase
MEKISPPVINKGDKIGIISPARFVNMSEVEGALQWLRGLGLIPVIGKHAFDRDNQFAGNDRDRASDLASFLQDPEIRGIWATRGGYGCIRLMPYLSGIDPSKNPKWLIGFSDLSVLHSWLNNQYNIQSIHGPMLFSWSDSEETRESFDCLVRMMRGEEVEYRFEVNPLNTTSEMEGELTGGNLSMILSLRGTSLDLEVSDKILFIEDIDEYLYHIDRIMQNLRQSGWLGKIRGLLVGGMTGMNDNNIPFGRTAEQIISDIAGDCGVPVIFSHPAGHIMRNIPLILGRKIKIEKENGRLRARQ